MSARSAARVDGAAIRDALRRFARAGSVYALGTLLVRSYTALLLPVYLAVLTPTDFGILAVTDVVTGSLTSVLGLCLDRAVTRDYYLWSIAERPCYLGAIWAASLGTTALATAALLWVGPVMFPWIVATVPFDPYLRLACLVAAFKALTLTPLMILRAREEAGQYVTVTAASSVTGSAAIVWLILVERLGARGVLLGTLANEAAWSLVWAVFMWRQSQLTARWRYLKAPLRYSLPLVPSEFSYSLCHGFDRFVLARLIPLSDLGVYAVAARVGRLFHEANQAAKNAWIPLAMRLAAEGGPGVPMTLAALGRVYVGVFLVLGVMVAVVAPDLVAALGGDAYARVGDWAPWFVLGYFGYVYYFVALVGISLSGRTEFVSVATVLFGVVNVVGALVLAPRLGGAGAIAAFAVAVYAMAGVAAWLSRQAYPIPFPGRESAALFVAGCVLAGAAIMMPGGWEGMAVKAVLVLAYAGLVGVRLRRGFARVPSVALVSS